MFDIITIMWDNIFIMPNTSYKTAQEVVLREARKRLDDETKARTRKKYLDQKELEKETMPKDEELRELSKRILEHLQNPQSA